MFPHSTIEHFAPKRGYVTLSGKVDTTSEYHRTALAVMPYVWRFAPVHGGHEDHGWRRASKYDHYGLDDNGEWSVTDVRPGVQYAVVVVDSEYFKSPSRPERMLDVLADTLADDPGTLPRSGLGLPEFTHRQYDVHIGSAPEEHLTGAVLGVSRATWDEPGPDGPAQLPFHVAAWVTNADGTFFIGVRECEPSGYWTFGEVVRTRKPAHDFTVALVTGGFVAPEEDAPSRLPVLGPAVLGIDSRPHEPLRTHGSGSGSPTRP